MGNTQNINSPHRQVEVFHQKFKMVEVMENSEEMVLSIPYEQKIDISEWQKLLKNVRDCDPQFLLMPKKYMIAEQGMCGSSGVIKIVFDCFTFSFEEEIINHAQKYKHFQETQIWYLLFAIISSVKQLDRLSMKVGDIRPHNIFVNQNGQVKLSGSFSWPRQVENYLKTSYDKTVTYLAPEQLHQCRVGQKGKRSHIIGESFSIGLTLLHTCLLKPMNELYNVKKFQFNVQKLQQQINELKKLSFWNEQKEKNQKYSNQLIRIIVGLLDLNENKRLTSLDLFNELQPHAEEILNLREFQIPNLMIATPTKQQSKTINASSNQQQRVSPPYSSIPRKQFNQPESLAFQTSYGLGIHGSKDINTAQNSVHLPVYLADKRTPQKRVRSKQKMQVSLSNEKVDIFSKTIQPPRESIGLGQQKFNSNPQVNFSVPTTEVQNRTYDGNFPSTYQYAGEFKTHDTQFQSYRPSIGSTLSHNVDKKFEVPSFNHTTSNYVSFQQRYEPPTQATEYRGTSQPPAFYFNQPQAASLTYKPLVPQQDKPAFPTTSSNYPFTRNIELANSQYTLLDNNHYGQLPQRPSIISNNQHQGNSYQTTVYQTSIVKPVYGGEMSFGTGFGQLNENKGTEGQSSDLLKKINEQLNKSKQMYHNGTTY